MMNVIRIVVDELPENCSTCIFAASDKDGYEICVADGYCDKQIDTERKTRPSWCSLVVEEVCEWEKEEYEEYEMYISPHNNGDWSDKDEYKFCPSCGRRIVYKESG